MYVLIIDFSQKRRKSKMGQQGGGREEDEQQKFRGGHIHIFHAGKPVK